MLMQTTPKAKKCEQCPQLFTPTRMGHVVCSPRCLLKKVAADERAKKERAKAERAHDRVRREAAKRPQDLAKEAEAAFNAWIRARDADDPCISCNKPPGDLSGLHAGRDAGHYRSVGSAKHLRYHEDNVHGQCVACNQWGAGKAVDYRIGLAKKIGPRRVEALEEDHTVKKWKPDEYREIRDTYRAKLKELQRTTT